MAGRNMAGLNERYDSALLGILQSEGQIAKFFDVIYGFLYRKTDFYLNMKDTSAKMGFPPGVALKLTVGAFRKYEEMAKLDEQRRAAAAATSVITSEAKNTELIPNPLLSVGKSSAKDVDSDAPKCSSSSSEECVDGNAKNSAQINMSNTAAEKDTPMETQEIPQSQAHDGNEPEVTEIQKQFQANADSYNGAVRDKYSWSQSIVDLDVHVKVPASIRKGADVKVDIEKKKLKVCYKDSSGEFITCVDGNLTWEIVKDESMWTLSPGEHVHINLEKNQERWWEALLTNEPKISVRKIDASRPITDLDDEAQAKIEEMMYNEHQKRLGKPQTHESKVHNMLKQAWDAEGSPFKGQPFDPSVVTVANQGMMGSSTKLPGT